MNSATISLPWPPSSNHYWGNQIIRPRVGKPYVNTYLTAAAKAFRLAVQQAIHKQFCEDVDDDEPLKPLDCRLAIHVVALMPDRRVRDLSNLLKATEDALTHADVWEDDSLIDRITIERGPVKKGGELLVTIEPMPEPAEPKGLF